MRIRSNIQAINAQRMFKTNNKKLSSSLEKLSSGYKINKAADDAAGLAISEKLRAQLIGLDTAVKNSTDGLSLVNTAEGAMTEIHDMLNRMSELCLEASNGIYEKTGREKMQDEIRKLTDEIDRIAKSTKFSSKHLLNGNSKSEVTISGGVIVNLETGMASTGTTTTTVTSADAEFQYGDVNGGIAASLADAKYVFSNTADGGIGDYVPLKGNTLSDVLVALSASGVKKYDAYKYYDFDGDSFSFTTTTWAEATEDQLKEALASADGPIWLQIGAESNGDNQLPIFLDDVTAEGLKLIWNDSYLNVMTPDKALNSLDIIDQAREAVSANRGKMGALQNRLEYNINSLENTSENIKAADSRIRDADMSKEIMEYTKNNITVQSAQSMLAQATLIPQEVLKLLQ